MKNNKYQSAFAEGLKPDKAVDVDEWSDKNVILSTSNAAEPGRYRSNRTPYMVEVMKQLSSSSPTQKVVLIAGAQVSKTQVGLNFVCSAIDQTPGPILIVQPTETIAKKVSNQRLGQMIQDCPVLSKKVLEDKTKDTTNTMLAKTFPGGVLYVTGANSAAGLRSMPVRFLMMDEIDAYPRDVDGEGSPVLLAEKRTTTFSRRKILCESTPTIKGESAIEEEYLKTDQRKYFVPCPHCLEKDIITWDRIHYENDDPNTAMLRCLKCNKLITESSKTWMLSNGEWRATATSYDPKVVGYHLNSLYSPIGWKSWKECVTEFIQAKNEPEKLKVFVNTVLAETWEEKAEQLDPHFLAKRREVYPSELPDGVVVLTCAVDVQDDRLEALVVGWGKNEESWIVAHTTVVGSPDKSETWNELSEFRRQGFKNKLGIEQYVKTTVIDSGGHFTNKVYQYAKSFENEGVYAIKGGHTEGKPLVSPPSKNNAYRCLLFMINTDTAKESIFTRLKMQHPGGGYVHIPNWADDEFIAQITSEKAIRKYIKGRGTIRQWVKTRERNEILDLMVYSLAALYLRGYKWVLRHLGSSKLARKPLKEAQVQESKKEEPLPEPAPYSRPAYEPPAPESPQSAYQPPQEQTEKPKRKARQIMPSWK